MKSKKRLYKDLNIIRFIACLAILLYHLNILKGGYLAVCTFFVISSYLSCISAFKKEKFSIVSYYYNRLIKLYIPLILVVFTTISIISFIPNITWLNLKPETTSIILAYNNFWQLKANLDYFARVIDSPFMHLWYISLLIQFDLIFPFIFLILRKIGDKIHKIISCLITLLLSLIGTIYFYKTSLTANIMFTYYHTFTRLFSLLFGLTLGFIHSYYKPLILKTIKEKKLINHLIFYLYLIILISLFIFIDANSPYFSLSMIMVTLISCRLIDYATINTNKHLNILEKIIKSFSSISYEIYLIQYPLIYLFQLLNISSNLKLPLMIILIIIISYLIHFSLNIKKESKLKIIRCIICLGIIIISTYGGYIYYKTKDHTQEMQKLEEQLNTNALLIEQKQEEYALKLEQEQNNWLEQLQELENNELELANLVKNLPIVGVGDSVMLGAVPNLYEQFPNGYFDAKISRTAWVVNNILIDLKNKNMLGSPIVLNLGANGDCDKNCKEEILKTCENREIFWLNVTNDNDVHVNTRLSNFAAKHKNLHVIDWNTISKNHPEYFIADKIHLTESGRKAYTKAIYDSIYEMYSQELNQKKEEALKTHEQEMQNKITFYGNDLLLNAFDYIENNYNDASFIINKEFTYETLKKEIEEALNNDTLTHKLVFAFDNTIDIDTSKYQELINLCQNHQIYLINTNKSLNISTDNENITIIDFSEDLPNYLMPDNIHLTKEGNIALSNLIKSSLN